MNIRTLTVALATTTILAGAASAATVQETIWFGGNAGQQGNGDVLSYTSTGGVSLDASAHKLNDDGTMGHDLAIGQWSTGLGVCSWLNSKGYCKEDHQVDGYGKNETVKLSFGETVSISKLYFSYVGSNDDFAFSMIDGEKSGSYYAKTDIDGSGYGYYAFKQDWTGSMFGVGASGWNDEWKLKGVKFSYDDMPPAVPLPAAGWMLLAGVGGLFAAKRRKSA